MKQRQNSSRTEFVLRREKNSISASHVCVQLPWDTSSGGVYPCEWWFSQTVLDTLTNFSTLFENASDCPEKHFRVWETTQVCFEEKSLFQAAQLAFFLCIRHLLHNPLHKFCTQCTHPVCTLNPYYTAKSHIPLYCNVMLKWDTAIQEKHSRPVLKWTALEKLSRVNDNVPFECHSSVNHPSSS